MPAAFISYSRKDSEFALRLARDLKAVGANVWLDQLDIKPGSSWDNAIEDALLDAQQMLVILSPVSVKSENVRDEISYALRQGKTIIPVLYMECAVPLRLERKQHIDFRSDYARGLSNLLTQLEVAHPDQTVIDQGTQTEAVANAPLEATRLTQGQAAPEAQTGAAQKTQWNVEQDASAIRTPTPLTSKPFEAQHSTQPVGPIVAVPFQKGITPAFIPKAPAQKVIRLGWRIIPLAALAVILIVVVIHKLNDGSGPSTPETMPVTNVAQTNPTAQTPAQSAPPQSQLGNAGSTPDSNVAATDTPTGAPATQSSTEKQQQDVYVACVFDPISNVRVEPSANSSIACSIDTVREIQVSTTPIRIGNGTWWRTDACGTTGYIANSQVRFNTNCVN